jgi:hypothetical protein
MGKRWMRFVSMAEIIADRDGEKREGKIRLKM